MAEPAARARDDAPPVRSILRVVATVVASALALLLVYALRQPILWILFALFIAVAASGPVNVLSRRMRRGFAITVVYGTMVLTPLLLAAILLPPLITAGVNLVQDLPGYVDDLEEESQKNKTLRDLNEKYAVTQKLSGVADDAVGKVGAAAGKLGGIGASVISSLFAIFTVLVLSIFMVARGRTWVDGVLARRPPPEREALRRALDRAGEAVGNYILGALAQAAVAGLVAFVVLAILGVPSPLALAVVIALFDLIPLVGATIGAVLVGVVTVFGDFPLDTIVWTVFAIGYQQFENYVIQPQIQKRAVELDPFLILVAVLFGGTLLGVTGAVIAIPVAATILIAIDEYRAYRSEAERPRGEPPQVGAEPAG